MQDFASIAAHDLKAPLRRIASFLKLLDDRYPVGKPLDSDAIGYVRYAVDNAARLQSMLDDVLEYAQAGRGGTLGAVDLNEIALDACSSLHRDDCELDLEPGSLPVVQGIPSLLSQLFANLFENSIKYSSADTDLKVSVRARPLGSGGGWRVSVADNGIGIADRDLTKVFEPFTRLHAGDAYGGGTGVGLAICRRAVEAHGGTIEAVSRPEGGTEIVFTLPANPGGIHSVESVDSTSGQDAEIIEVAGPAKTQTMATILVVDDDATDCMLIREAFESRDDFDANVDFENSGDAALRRIQSAGTPYDLVLLDLKMPGMSGLEVLKRIRSDPATAEIDVAILSTSSANTDREQARRLEIIDYLVKPSTGDYTEVLTRVDEILKRA